MNVLPLGAHPDDIEIFMYGLLSRLKKDGNKIYLTVATDGSKGGEYNEHKLLKTRAVETKKALKSLNKENTKIVLKLAKGGMFSFSTINNIFSQKEFFPCSTSSS